MAEFPPALPHGALTQILPEVFSVTGGVRMAAGLTITRAMTVLRQGGDLVLVNSVRLSPAGEAALDALGRVTHVVRLGAFHGMDDPYYVDRYKATHWAPAGVSLRPGLTAQDLAPGACPVDDAQVFLFESGRHREAALLLPREGGVLVTCDALQHWTTFQGCSLLGRVMLPIMGFGPAVIGGPWTKAMGPGVRADFDRLTGLSFKHLIPGHGTLLRDTAHDGLRTAILNRFGS